MAFAKVTLNGETLMDVTQDTVQANNLLTGYTAHKADGTAVTGTASGGSTINNQNKTVSPTESKQTITADSGYTGLGTVTVNAISSTYVGTGIATRSSANLTASGSVVTAPAGYYSSAATKSVSGGSAFTPAVTITKNPTISLNSGTAVITATYAGSSSITPSVTAGYIAAGTAGTVSTAGTSTFTLASKAAATYNTSTADQTITSYQWLVGAQTIKSVTTANIAAANIKVGTVVRVGDANNASRITQVTGTFTNDANAAAADIASGKTAYVNGSKITGTLSFITYYSGSTAPSSSLGNNGDIYLQS